MTTTTSKSEALLRTPFHRYHLERGAKMVDFAGWEMPIHYGSIIEEHRQVRTSGGIFDVSHMGRFRLTGRDVQRFLDHVCTRQIYGMKVGQCRYSLVCNEQGGCHDDVLVYKVADGDYFMVCNAANRAKLLDHFAQVRGDLIFKLLDETEITGMIALQGPNVMELIGGFSSEIPALKRYRFTIKNLFIAKVLVSRTGYTGEDGVEVILPAKFADKAVNMLLSNAPGDAIKPAGLGARDSLRLEAGMPLYGHEIEEDFDPISAGLNFAVKLEKDSEAGSFIGQEALQQIAAEGPKRRLMGFLLEGKRTARQEMKVHHDGREVGFITSGCWSPTLERSIAMGYIETALAEPGVSVSIDPDKLNISAEVCTLPFYKAG